MAKVFGILLIVLGVWVGLEIYTKGTHGAFGGIFAGAFEPVSDYQAAPDGRSPVQRITDQVRGDIERGAERTTRNVD